jgi:hypothetical protein
MTRSMYSTTGQFTGSTIRAFTPDPPVITLQRILPPTCICLPAPAHADVRDGTKHASRSRLSSMLSRRISGSGSSDAFHAPTSPLPRNDPRISQRLVNDLQSYNAMDQTVPNISSHGVIYPNHGAPDVPTLIRRICVRLNQSIHWTSALRVFCGTAGSGDLSDDLCFELHNVPTYPVHDESISEYQISGVTERLLYPDGVLR